MVVGLLMVCRRDCSVELRVVRVEVERLAELPQVIVAWSESIGGRMSAVRCGLEQDLETVRHEWR